jgi:hypothetical protein
MLLLAPRESAAERQLINVLIFLFNIVNHAQSDDIVLLNLQFGAPSTSRGLYS